MTGRIQTIKQMVSWVIGVPAAVITLSGINDVNYIWLYLVALGTLVAVLRWNIKFEKFN